MPIIYTLVKLLTKLVAQLTRIADAQEELVIHQRYISKMGAYEGGDPWCWEMARQAKLIKDQRWWLDNCEYVGLVSNPDLHPEIARDIWEYAVSDGYCGFSDQIALYLARHPSTPHDVLEQMVDCTDDAFAGKYGAAVQAAAERLGREDTI